MNKSEQTILVTGGAGFIGANFIHYWAKHHPQDKIINFDALTYAGNLESLKALETSPNYVFVEGDIANIDQVDQVMNQADLVVHFAAESHVDRSILDPSVFVRTNVLGTQVLLESALKHKIKHFHHISTDEVFGSLKLNSDEQFNEQTPYDPRSPYSASKAGSDHLVRAYGETYGLPFTITNCSNNYGPYQHPEKFIPVIITKVMNNQPVPVYGDGLNVRDWLFVEDHCSAIETVITKAKKGSTYVVGGLSQDYSNLDIVKMIIKLMGKDQDLIEFVKDRPGHDRRYSVDWSKINKDLGWKPSVTLEEGLQQTIDWYLHNQAWWQPLIESSADYFDKNYTSKKQ